MSKLNILKSIVCALVLVSAQFSAAANQNAAASKKNAANTTAAAANAAATTASQEKIEQVAIKNGTKRINKSMVIRLL